MVFPGCLRFLFMLAIAERFREGERFLEGEHLLLMLAIASCTSGVPSMAMNLSRKASGVSTACEPEAVELDAVEIKIVPGDAPLRVAASFDPEAVRQALVAARAAMQQRSQGGGK